MMLNKKLGCAKNETTASMDDTTCMASCACPLLHKNIIVVCLSVIRLLACKAAIVNFKVLNNAEIQRL